MLDTNTCNVEPKWPLYRADLYKHICSTWYFVPFCSDGFDSLSDPSSVTVCFLMISVTMELTQNTPLFKISILLDSCYGFARLAVCVPSAYSAVINTSTTKQGAVVLTNSGTHGERSTVVVLHDITICVS